jgi:hypothetical protein
MFHLFPFFKHNHAELLLRTRFASGKYVRKTLSGFLATFSLICESNLEAT